MQRTPPAVVVLGGIPTATQNVAGPPQHVLQPVPAASLPPPLFGPATEMEQQKTNTQAANEEQTTTVQNCNIKELEEKSNLDSSNEAVQRQILPIDAGNSQNLSDRLSACDTGEDRKGQDLHYRYNTEKTSLEHGETEMAEGMGLCQDWTPNPGVAVKMEKGPQASEKADLEHTSKTAQEEVHETKHSARKSICFPTIQSSSAVSIAHKATDSDHKQPADMEQFQTAPSLHSAQSSLLPESNVQKIVQQPLTATITANMEILKKSSSASSSMDEVTKERLAADEGSIGSSSTASKKECDNSDTVGFSAKQGESVSRLPVPTGNGNSTQNNADKDVGCSQQSSVAAVSTPNAAFPQKTLDPCHLPQNTHGRQANQLSTESINCSGTPKSVLTGIKSSATGEKDIKTDSLHETGVCYDISIKEPKVLGYETCTHDIPAPKVTEEAHVVARSYGIAKQNDCAKSMQTSPYQDNQPDGSCILLHKNKCTDSEGLDSNEPCLSPVIQEGQEAILVDHKLPQVDCLNDAISASDTMNVDIKNDEVSEDFSALNAVETKSLIDVGILVQPGMEDTWLVVSDHSPLIDGQCQSTEDAEMIDVSTEVMGDSPESQTSVAVYECTEPCFSPDAIHEAAKLLLPEKGVEVTADKHSFEPLSETLTQDLDALSSHSPNVLASQKVLSPPTSSTSSANICMQNMVLNPTFCSNAESTINVLDSALINSPSAVQVEQGKFVENKSDISQVSSSVIDPKLLILKRGEALLKQPPTLTLVSRNQNPSGTPSECLDRVSVECLSEYDLTTGIVTEKAAKAPLSFHVLNAPCNITCPSSKDESKKQALIDSEHCLQFEKQIPEDDLLLNSASSAQSQTLYTARLPSRSGSMCSTITDQSEGPANQEVEEQHSPVPHLTEVKDAQDSTLEQLDASVGESSEGEADCSLEAQPSESIVIPSPAQNKVNISVYFMIYILI